MILIPDQMVQSCTCRKNIGKRNCDDQYVVSSSMKETLLQLTYINI